jgi:hypothetical protein
MLRKGTYQISELLAAELGYIWTSSAEKKKADAQSQRDSIRFRHYERAGILDSGRLENDDIEAGQVFRT